MYSSLGYIIKEETSRQVNLERRRNGGTFRWWATWRVDVDRSRTLSHGSRGQVDKSPFPGRTSREKRERKIGSDQQRIQHPSPLSLSLSLSLSFTSSLARSLVHRLVPPLTLKKYKSRDQSRSPSRDVRPGSATELRDSPSTLRVNGRNICWKRSAVCRRGTPFNLPFDPVATTERVLPNSRKVRWTKLDFALIN